MNKRCVIRLWASSVVLSGVVFTGPLPCFSQSSAPANPNSSTTPESKVRSQLQSARAFERRHRLDLATPLWRDIIGEDPRNVEALGGLARAAAQSGDFTLASMYADRLRVIDSGDPAIGEVQKLREAGASTGQSSTAAIKDSPAAASQTPPDEAAAYQALDANRLAEAESRFKAILAHHPENSGALAGIGYVRLAQHNYPGAISYLERARQKRPADKVVANALETARFRFLIAEGDQSLAGGDAAAAEQRYRSALDLRRVPEALAGLGQSLLARNAPSDAIPFFEQALALQPGDQVAWRGLVVAQSRSGNSTAAIQSDQRTPDSIRTALRGDAVYLQALASAQSQAGRPGDVQGSLEAALNLPLDGAAKRTIQMQLADMYLAQGQSQRALQFYQQMTSDRIGDVAAWRGLINTEHVLGRDDEALAAFDRMPIAASDAAMRQPDFVLLLARVYRSQKRLDIAQDLLQKALADPASAVDGNQIQM